MSLAPDDDLDGARKADGRGVSTLPQVPGERRPSYLGDDTLLLPSVVKLVSGASGPDHVVHVLTLI